MTTLSRKTVVTALIVPLLLVLNASALAPPEQIFPAETAVFVKIPNFQTCRQQLEKTSFYKLYTDPAMAEFTEHLEAKLKEKIKSAEDEFSKIILETDVRPTGPVSAAFLTGEKFVLTGEQAGFLIISSWGPHLEEVKQTLADLVEKAVEQGAQRSADEYRSVQITTIKKERAPMQVPQYSPPAEDSPEAQPQVEMKTVERAPVTIHYCFIEDALLAGIDVKPEAIRFAIAHLQGATGDDLAGLDHYKAAVNALDENRNIEVFVNIKQFIDSAVAADDTGKTKTQLANLGVDNVTSFAGSLTMVPKPGTTVRAVGSLKIAGEKKGLVKMLSPLSASIDPPSFIRPSAYSVGFMHLDIKAAYEELFKILNAVNPAMAAPLTVPLPAPEGEPGLELKKDVIDHFGSQIVFAETIKKPSPAEGETPTTGIWCLSITNRTALEKSLGSLHNTMISQGSEEYKREFLGHTIYTIPLGRMLGMQAPPPGSMNLRSPRPVQQPQPTPPQMPKVAFTLTDTHIVIGTDESVELALRAAANKDAPSVSQADWYRAAKANLPARVGFAAMSNDVESAELMYKQLKKLADAGSQPTTMQVNPFVIFSQGLREFVDLSLLPEFDVLRKYFGLSTSYVVNRPDGFYFESEQLDYAAEESD